MLRIAWAALLGLTSAAGIARGGEGQEVRLGWVGDGVTTREGWAYVQPRTPMSAIRPATLRVVPAGVKHPEYGVLPVGSQSLKRVFHVVTDADEAGGLGKRIWVDTNGDGDLTNDPPVKGWEEGHEETKGEVHRWYTGYGQVDIGPAGRPCVATLGLLTSKGEKGDELVYWRDYMRTGRVEIGGAVYRVWLDDWLATGDFTGETLPQDTLRKVPRIGFLVDRNGNGECDGASEGFEVGKPFNIGGVTYEIRDMTPSGDFFRIAKSSRDVEELPLAADIAVGKVAPAFVGPGLDGRKVHVPGDFKGKVVLLEFWATWCGPCIRLVPQIRDVYAKYHGKGLEVVGVSEDDAADRQKVIDMVKQERMNWVQIYDGKADYTEAAVRYGAGALPWAALLDGDTGVVLATEFHKEGLDAVVEREMRKKGLLGE